LPRGAAREEVKIAYRKLAREWHPDAHASGGKLGQLEAESKFKKIQQAYDKVTGKERFVWAAPKTGMHHPTKAPSQASMPLSSRQKALWLCGLVVGTCAFGSALETWKKVTRRRMYPTEHDSETVIAFTRQTKVWQETMDVGEVRELLEQRRKRAIADGVQEGMVGAVNSGSCAALLAAGIKGVERMGAMPKVVTVNPLIAFHIRTPTLLFYISAASLLGFWDRGFAAVSPQGRLHKVRETQEGGAPRSTNSSWGASAQ